MKNKDLVSPRGIAHLLVAMSYDLRKFIRDWQQWIQPPTWNEHTLPLLVVGEDGVDELKVMPPSLTRSKQKSTLIGFCTFVKRTLCSVGLYLLPSFVQDQFSNKSQKARALHSTAYLDGLRGFASLFVFFYHYSYAYFPRYNKGYGQGDDGQNLHFIQLHVIRILYAGPAMVRVFFVISGYALSYKPLKLLRNGSWEQLLHAMASSTFRRAARLFLPTLISTFIVLLMIRLGFYEYPRRFAYALPGYPEPHADYLESISVQFWNWVSMCQDIMLNVWLWDSPMNVYDGHLWSIPVEFRGSMVLFITIIGLARVRVVFRLSLGLCLCLYCYHYGRWDIQAFLSGMLIAEIHMIRNAITNDEFRIKKFKYEIFSRCWWLLIFFLSLFLLSAPEDNAQASPGFIYLSSIITQNNFLMLVGAILLVWSVGNTELLQKLFTNAFAQYLANISYALYLVHGPVLHTVGYSLVPNIMNIIGKETLIRYCLGFCVASCIIVPVVFWIADVFWRLVDVKTVQFAKWTESKVLVSSLLR